MLRLMKNHISLVCNDAIKSGFLVSNPISLVSLKATKETKEKDALSSDMIRLIANSNAKTANTLMILIYTGMRINELIKIKPEDIHPELEYMVSGEKTEAGRERIIPIHPYIMPLIKQWKEKPDFRSDSTFDHYLQLDLENVYHADFSSHYCRHTFASMCDDAEITIYTTKKIIGHAIPKSDVTGSVYTHKNPEKLIEEIKKLPCPNDL